MSSLQTAKRQLANRLRKQGLNPAIGIGRVNREQQVVGLVITAHGKSERDALVRALEQSPPSVPFKVQLIREIKPRRLSS